MSFSASSRKSSPITSPAITAIETAAPKQSKSSEKRRPTTPLSRSSMPSSLSSRPTTTTKTSRASTPVRDLIAPFHSSSRRLLTPRTVDGLWPSMRSLSSSFQSDFRVSISQRDKPSFRNHSSKSQETTLLERKSTFPKGKNVSDQLKSLDSAANLRLRTVDQQKWPRFKSGKLPPSAMTRSMDLTDKFSTVSSLPNPSRGVSPPRMKLVSNCPGKVIQKPTITGMRRMSLDITARTHHHSNLNVGSDIILNRSNRMPSVPSQGAQCRSFPNKGGLPSAPSSRGISTPSTARPSALLPLSSSATGRAGASSSILSYITEVRNAKKIVNHADEAHHLRILFNQYLQWCFMNNIAENAMFLHKEKTESALYNVWVVTSELLESVIKKKIRMQRLRQEMKLDLILTEQIEHTEDWASIEREHSISLSEATEALKERIVCLPVTVTARANIHAVKNVICSSVDVMQAMGSSICNLFSKVAGMNSIISELACVVIEESVMLNECRELLASFAAMQIQESSLRTQHMQHCQS